MKKKIISALLCASMVATMVAGCGGSSDTTSTDNSNSGAAAPATESGSDAAETDTTGDEGKVFNIYCWNEEFKSRLTDHYPGYEEVDATTGKIGDVTVKWNITPSDDNAYQNNLDATLLKQESAAADDKIDLFLVEADYALKYVDTDYTMPIADLGITDADLANQYQYTKDIVFHGRAARAYYSITVMQQKKFLEQTILTKFRNMFQTGILSMIQQRQ